MKKLTGILIFFSLFFVQKSFSQPCNDPEAWNYVQGAGSDTTCIYLIDCESNEVNRLFSLGLNPAMPYGDVYIISIDEVDTLAHAVYNYSGFGWDSQMIQACMDENSCYYMDIYPEDTLLSAPWVKRFYPNSTTFEGYFLSPPGSRDYYRMLVSAEENTCGVLGCTDITALNYWSYATVNVGCEYCDENALLLTPDLVFSSESLGWQIRQNGEYVTGGNLNSVQGNTSHDLACLSDGCYELVLNGDAWNFSSIILQLDGDTLVSASLTQNGEVTAPFGINSEPCFNPGEIYGCTNPLGQNYNPQATIDNGSCDLQNSECNLDFEIYQDSITGAIHFDVDIYSTDYPIDIFWDFGDGSPIISDWWTPHTYDSIGIYQVCATLYSMQFFENEPLCYDETCITLNPDDFGVNGLFLIILDDISTSIETISEASKLSLSPNPVRDIIRWSLPQNQSLSKIKVYSLDGRLVIGVPDLQGNHQQKELNVSQLASGTYIIHAEGMNGNIYSGRFVKL